MAEGDLRRRIGGGVGMAALLCLAYKGLHSDPTLMHILDDVIEVGSPTLGVGSGLVVGKVFREEWATHGNARFPNLFNRGLRGGLIIGTVGCGIGGPKEGTIFLACLTGANMIEPAKKLGERMGTIYTRRRDNRKNSKHSKQQQ